MPDSRYINRRSHIRIMAKTGKVVYVSGCSYLKRKPLKRKKLPIDK